MSQPYKHESTRRIDSSTCPGVSFILKKMTEGRRIKLRADLATANTEIREIMRKQADIEAQPQESRDNLKWLELDDRHQELMLTVVNPTWIIWGVKQVEGLEVEGKSLGVEDWGDWPSVLFNEVVKAVQDETELNGGDVKNSLSPTTSGGPVGGNQKSSTADIAGESDSTKLATAPGTSQIQ